MGKLFPKASDPTDATNILPGLKLALPTHPVRNSVDQNIYEVVARHGNHADRGRVVA